MVNKEAPEGAPRFIAFEGIDGSGKTLQALWLTGWLQKRGYKVFLTEEPMRDSATGYFVKLALRNKERYPAEVYLLLFLQDRLNHIENYIKPALSEGKIVITDRYHFSTLAYQQAQGIKREKIENVVKALEMDIPIPDIIFFIDVSPRTAVERLYGRNKDVVDLYEREEFLSKVRENYLSLAEEYGFVIVDGERDPEKVHKDIIRKIEGYYP